MFKFEKKKLICNWNTIPNIEKNSFNWWEFKVKGLHCNIPIKQCNKLKSKGAKSEDFAITFNIHQLFSFLDHITTQCSQLDTTELFIFCWLLSFFKFVTVTVQWPIITTVVLLLLMLLVLPVDEQLNKCTTQRRCSCTWGETLPLEWPIPHHRFVWLDLSLRVIIFCLYQRWK